MENFTKKLANVLSKLETPDSEIIDEYIDVLLDKTGLSRGDLMRTFKHTYQTTPCEFTKREIAKREVKEFAKWAKKRLAIKNFPKIILSYDTNEARDNHHTGGYTIGGDKIWVYAKNRNLVDILRSVFHELTHVQQYEKGLIKPDSAATGSPIERMADQEAGIAVKDYGKENHKIFW
jgi:hypothetical protein